MVPTSLCRKPLRIAISSCSPCRRSSRCMRCSRWAVMHQAAGPALPGAAAAARIHARHDRLRHLRRRAQAAAGGLRERAAARGGGQRGRWQAGPCFGQGRRLRRWTQCCTGDPRARALTSRECLVNYTSHLP